jgi:SAM-dependent methyltransferase
MRGFVFTYSFSERARAALDTLRCVGRHAPRHLLSWETLSTVHRLNLLSLPRADQSIGGRPFRGIVPVQINGTEVRLEISNSGWYHAILIADRLSTYHIGGLRANSPLRDPAKSDVLLQCLQNAGECPELAGKRVADIGAAEGFFTFYSAAAGAYVTAIEQFPQFAERLRTIASHRGIERSIRLLTAPFPMVGADAVVEADVVWCLGLIYHLGENFAASLALQARAKRNATVVIEGVFYRDEEYEPSRLTELGHSREFDPDHHVNNTAVCWKWVDDYFTIRGFQVVWIPEWQRYAEQPGLLNHGDTRRLAVLRRVVG